MEFYGGRKNSASKKKINYQIIEDGSQRGGPILISNNGYSYGLKTKSKLSTVWKCSRRTPGANCRAKVIQCGDEFIPSSEQHVHSANKNLPLRIQVLRAVRMKAQEQISRPVGEIVEEIYKSIGEEQRSLLPDKILMHRVARRSRSKTLSSDSSDLESMLHFHELNGPFFCSSFLRTTMIKLMKDCYVKNVGIGSKTHYDTIEDGDVDSLLDEAFSINLEIPDILKEVLNQDYFAVKTKRKLLKLPASPNVVSVLENFVKMYTVNMLYGSYETDKEKGHLICPDLPRIPINNCISLYKELVDSLRISFDFLLPLILLYGPEKYQYKKLVSTFRPPQAQKRECPRSEHLQSPYLQSPSRLRSSSRHQPSVSVSISDEPEVKIPKLSPPMKEEEVETKPEPETEPVSPRRFTRRTLHEVRSTQETSKIASTLQNGSHTPDKKGVDKKSEQKKKEIHTRSSRRLSSGGPMSPVSSKESSDKSQVTDNQIKTCKVSLLKETNFQSTSSSQSESSTSSSRQKCDDKETIYSSLGKDKLIEQILAWQLLPTDVIANSPVTPSIVYGPHHLIRLFVKLPEVVQQMDIAENKLKVMAVLIKELIQHLVERHDQLFANTAYMDAELV